jgi:homopolymeric O-antigen transport system permease protein
VENLPPSRLHLSLGLRDLYRYRELAGFLALRDLKLRYRQTALGLTWALVQPLGAMAVFAAVALRLDNVPSGGTPYELFAFSGLAIWFYVSSSVASAAESLTRDPALVSKVFFPRLIAPLAAVLPGLVDLFVTLLALVPLILIFDGHVSWAVLLAPVWVAAAMAVAVAVGLWLAALNVLFRDVRYALGFALQLWLFASPVLYGAELFGEGTRTWLGLNPLVGLLEGARWSLIDGRAPGLELLVSGGSLAVILLGGLAFFGQTEQRFSDLI